MQEPTGDLLPYSRESELDAERVFLRAELTRLLGKLGSEAQGNNKLNQTLDVGFGKLDQLSEARKKVAENSAAPQSFIVLASSHLCTLDIFGQMRREFERVNNPELLSLFDECRQTYLLSTGGAFTQVKIDGISFEDMYKGQWSINGILLRTISTVGFMNQWIVKGNEPKTDELLSSKAFNPSDLTDQKYPLTKRESTIFAVRHAYHSFFADHPNLDQAYFVYKDPHIRDSIRAAKKISDEYQHIKLSVRNSLTRMDNSPEDSQVLSFYEAALQSQELIIPFLRLIGFDGTATSIVPIYRQLQEVMVNSSLAIKARYEPLFRFLQYYICHDEDREFLTIDQLPLLDNAHDQVPVTNQEHKTTLRNAYIGITNITSKLHEFEIDPSIIEALGFETPTQLSLRIMQEKKDSVEILIVWEMEDDEPFTLKLVLDLGKKQTEDSFLGWNLVEDPQDTNNYVRQVMLRLAKLTLEGAKNKAIAFKQQTKSNLNEAGLGHPHLRTYIKQPVDEETRQIYLLRKAARKQALAAQVRGVIKNRPSDDTLPGQKSLIAVEAEGNALIDDLIRDFPIEVQERIRQSIFRFNTDGLGNFRVLEDYVYEGKPVGRLRVSTPRGPYRVLATKEEGGMFKPYQIVKRDKNTY